MAPDRYHDKTEDGFRPANDIFSEDSSSIRNVTTPIIDVESCEEETNREKLSTSLHELCKNAKSKAVGGSSRFVVESRRGLARAFEGYSHESTFTSASSYCAKDCSDAFAGDGEDYLDTPRIPTVPESRGRHSRHAREQHEDVVDDQMPSVMGSSIIPFAVCPVIPECVSIVKNDVDPHDDSMVAFLQHESGFQPQAFADPDDVEWVDASQARNEFRYLLKIVEEQRNKVLAMCSGYQTTDFERKVVNAVFCVATLHDLEHGVHQASTLQPNGSYKHGPLLQ